jgi:hypothetical protein
MDIELNKNFHIEVYLCILLVDYHSKKGSSEGLIAGLNVSESG